MARPKSGRATLVIDYGGIAEAANPQMRPCWALSGMNVVLPLSRLSNGECRLVQNLSVRDNAYEARLGTSVVGSQAGGRLTGVVEIIRQNNTSFIARAGESGIQVIQGDGWQPTIGDSFVTTYSQNFSFTGWGESLICSGGTELYRLEGTIPPELTRLTGTFIPTDEILHLTTFAGRVIASSRNGIHWSTKFDSDDWSGQGSGFEDLRSAPGGMSDHQTAVIPITDEIAFVIRTNSIWQMTQTGDPDAPFRFSLIRANIGSRWAQAVAAVRNGVVITDFQQVWLLTIDGIQEIGAPIRTMLPISNGMLRTMSATFDIRWNEYRLTIPTAASAVAQKVLRFNLDRGSWVEDTLPFPVRAMSFSHYHQPITIDELVGTIDNLVGSIDDLGIGDRRGTTLYVMGQGARLIARDNLNRNNELERDVDTSGATTEGGFRIETGDINIGGSIRTADGYELQLEYESERDCEITLEYSTDGGVSWVYLHQMVIPATTRPTIKAIHFSTSRDAIQYAISASATPRIRLIDLIAVASSGGSVADAH